MTTLWGRNRFLKVTIWRLPFGGTFWLAGLAGRRFLVLIIKVTLSELSEASAPSTCNYVKNITTPFFVRIRPLLDRKGEWVRLNVQIYYRMLRRYRY